MFGLFNKTKGTTNAAPLLAVLVADMHSHILPGIDDGAKTIEDSLSLIGTLVAQGYTKLIATPHIYQELYPNTPQTIQAAYELLLPHVQKQFPQVQLSYAAEYYMDDVFENMLSNNQKLLTVHDNWVLVEHSFMQAPPNLKQLLFNLQMNGYTPILAHPERYEFYTKNLKDYDSLYDAGCIFQVNVLSLTGYYGATALSLAKHLLQKNYIKLLGTDIHHQRHQAGFDALGNNKLLQQVIAQQNLLNHTLTN